MIIYRKRMGVYGLFLTWILTAFLNLLIPRTISPGTRIAALLIVLLFIINIRPVWKSLV